MAGGLAACPVAPLHAGERGRGGWKPRRPHGARGAAAGAEPGGRRQPGSSRLPPEPGLVDAARCRRGKTAMACAPSPPFWPWCRVCHIRPRLAGKSSRSGAKAPSGSCASCAAHQQGAALAQYGRAGKVGKDSPGTLAPERRPVVHKHGSAGRFSTLRPL